MEPANVCIPDGGSSNRASGPAGCRFDPLVWQHSFVEIGHEIISTAILPLPLIQVGQLLVTGEKMCTILSTVTNNCPTL